MAFAMFETVLCIRLCEIFLLRQISLWPHVSDGAKEGVVGKYVLGPYIRRRLTMSCPPSQQLQSMSKLRTSQNKAERINRRHSTTAMRIRRCESNLSPRTS